MGGNEEVVALLGRIDEDMGVHSLVRAGEVVVVPARAMAR